ncbi:MAG: thioredoxin domain-containing protein [Alphaproteobacteria bacterium]|nr:MAG: thioredoxin domain-containing protein [Alphaproteobacteria bacterium]
MSHVSVFLFCLSGFFFLPFDIYATTPGKSSVEVNPSLEKDMLVNTSSLHNENGIKDAQHGEGASHVVPCIKGPEYRYGKKDAPIQITLYSSLTCGHCANFHMNTLPAIKKKYIRPGNISIVLRFFPMDSPSLRATMFVRSLTTQSERRKAIDALYAQQEEWVFAAPEELALKIAMVTGHDILRVRKALGNKNEETKILLRLQDFEKRGLDATPIFTIGAKVYDWELSWAEFQEKVDPLVLQIPKTALL